jgi:hypothetical protein
MAGRGAMQIRSKKAKKKELVQGYGWKKSASQVKREPE